MKDHLTVIDPITSEAQRITPDGMAHWAGTGPEKTTCRECVYWLGGNYSRETKQLSDARCEKYMRMMSAAWATEQAPDHRVPWYTASCKYFDPAAFAPPVVKPPKKKRKKVDVEPNA